MAENNNPDEKSLNGATGLGQSEEASRPESAFRFSKSRFSLDFDRLFSPISDEAPCGQYLRYEGTYDLIREARRQEDMNLPQGVWERKVKRADWQKSIKLCAQALENDTKDLQIAIWLMEAMFQAHGYAGLAEGLHVVLEICRRYWDNMYPAVENGDLEGRISPVVWINEKLAYQLKLEPLSDPKSTDHVPCSFSDWERANMMENLAARDNAKFQELEAKGEITRSKFLGSVMFTPRAFYVALLEEIRQTRQLTLELGEFYDQVCGKDAPSLHSFRDILGEIRRLVENFLKEKEPERAFEAEEGNNKDTDFLDEDSAPDSPTGKRVAFLSIRNRSEAYRMLSEAADYLLIHEPHSPTPYLVKRAVSWGHMTLTELLEELIGDEQNLEQIMKLLGLSKQQE